MRSITTRLHDPGDLLARLPEGDVVAWIRHGDGLAGWGEAHRIPIATDADRFAAADDALRAWFAGVHPSADVPAAPPGVGPVAFASFTFDPHDKGSSLVVPRVTLARHHGAGWMTVVDEDAADGRPPPALAAPVPLAPAVRVRYAGSSVSELEWLEAVAAAADAIRGSGTLEKVVLARDLSVWAAEPLDPRMLARRLAERFDGCWTFICDGLVGATPELLVRRTGERVESIVLAGSAARGRDRDDDEAAGRALLASKKDRVEHELAVESVVDALRPVTRALDVDDEPSLLRLANVQHLATRVGGRLTDDRSALALAGLLHPTAAVCGTPTDVALDRIRTTEGMDRARYAGPVGWVDHRGDGEFGIALRCAEVAGTRGRLFTGAGIVGDSLPELELEETRLKLRAMQSALESTAP